LFKNKRIIISFIFIKKIIANRFIKTLLKSLFYIFKENIGIKNIKERIKTKKLREIIINKFKKCKNIIKKGELSDFKL